MLFDTSPAISTSVVTVVLETSVARRRTFPSSISRMSPTFTSSGKPLKVVPHMVTSPTTSSIVILKVAPLAR